MNKLLPFAILILTIVCGCANQRHEGELDEAAEVHLEALAIADSLKQALNALEAQQHLRDSLTRWRTLLAQWEASLPEVPGMEHDHHHGHTHHHERVDLTPAQALEVQRALKNEILELAKRINRQIE